MTHDLWTMLFSKPRQSVGTEEDGTSYVEGWFDIAEIDAAIRADERAKVLQRLRERAEQCKQIAKEYDASGEPLSELSAESARAYATELMSAVKFIEAWQDQWP